MKSIEFYCIKLFIIIITGNLYFFLGAFCSYYIDKYIALKNFQNKSKLTVLSHLIFEISLLLIVVYFIRKVVKFLFKPLANIDGFDLYKVKELNGSVILAFSFLMFLKSALSSKTKYLFE